MSIKLTLQPELSHIQGLTDGPIQISTTDVCCRFPEFDGHSHISVKSIHMCILMIHK